MYYFSNNWLRHIYLRRINLHNQKFYNTCIYFNYNEITQKIYKITCNPLGLANG